MKTKTLVTAVAFSSLLTLGGTAFAAADPHDGYNVGLAGLSSSQISDTMGKAAYGTPGSVSTGAGHDAYNQAFLGASPSKPDTDTMGKAAYGTSTSSIDGLAAYRSAFPAD